MTAIQSLQAWNMNSHQLFYRKTKPLYILCIFINVLISGISDIAKNTSIAHPRSILPRISIREKSAEINVLEMCKDHCNSMIKEFKSKLKFTSYKYDMVFNSPVHSF